MEPLVKNSEIVSTCPLSRPEGQLRILLGPSASKALNEAATASDVFLVIERASYPDDPSRWAIHAIPALRSTVAKFLEKIRSPKP